MPGIKALTGCQGAEWVLRTLKVCVTGLVLKLLAGLRPILACGGRAEASVRISGYTVWGGGGAEDDALKGMATGCGLCYFYYHHYYYFNISRGLIGLRAFILRCQGT